MASHKSSEAAKELFPYRAGLFDDIEKYHLVYDHSSNSWNTTIKYHPELKMFYKDPVLVDHPSRCAWLLFQQQDNFARLNKIAPLGINIPSPFPPFLAPTVPTHSLIYFYFFGSWSCVRTQFPRQANRSRHRILCGHKHNIDITAPSIRERGQ
jgi:hypothetical protein